MLTQIYPKNKNIVWRERERNRSHSAYFCVLVTLFHSKRIEQSSPREAKCLPARGKFPPVTKSEVIPPCSQDYAPKQDELKPHSCPVSLTTISSTPKRSQ